MVGLAGFEPATSRPPDERATRLRYSPTKAGYISEWGLCKRRFYREAVVRFILLRTIFRL